MVVLNKITTKTGDDGTSGLATGERRRKNDLRFEAIGSIDEANAAIGLARLHAGEALDPLLANIQNDLFDLGADLSTPETPKVQALRISQAQVARLESETGALNAALTPLTSFILPGGSPGAAHLHVARTVARRAERAMVALAGQESVSPPALQYINRLSDFLFVAARTANDGGRADHLWVPGANRGNRP
ncbi:MAG: cob(I)yrinic acid a,c-diamide adenosyltransferase [Alphaproteobacteria bacterium]